MKKVLLLMFLTGSLVQAQFTSSGMQMQSSGGEAGGGGDDCENRIQLIADDIKTWIKQGGSSYLKFEGNLNAETYNSEMIKVLNVVSSNELVSNVVECTSEKVYVNGTEKTCRWEISEAVSEQGFKIFCNYDRFMNGVSDENKNLDKEDAQYQLVHHEIAGVAGVEGSYKDRSYYYYSNQIVASLENVLIKKLAVGKLSNTESKKIDCMSIYVAKANKSAQAKFIALNLLTFGLASGSILPNEVEEDANELKFLGSKHTSLIRLIAASKGNTYYTKSLEKFSYSVLGALKLNQDLDSVDVPDFILQVSNYINELNINGGLCPLVGFSSKGEVRKLLSYKELLDKTIVHFQDSTR